MLGLEKDVLIFHSLPSKMSHQGLLLAGDRNLFLFVLSLFGKPLCIEISF